MGERVGGHRPRAVECVGRGGACEDGRGRGLEVDAEVGRGRDDRGESVELVWVEEMRGRNGGGLEVGREGGGRGAGSGFLIAVFARTFEGRARCRHREVRSRRR